MPLDDFISEVMDVLTNQYDVREVLVERVKFLRYAEANGHYDQVVKTLNASDPHSS